MKKYSRQGLLYTVESQFIAAVEYEEIGETLLLRVQDQTDAEIPREAFLVTQDPAEGSKSFLVSLSWDIYPEESETEKILTGHRKKSAACTNVRGDLRVSVEMNILLESPALKEPVNAEVKNISARGIFFWTKALLSIGESVSFTLPLAAQSLRLVAQIVNKIPTSKQQVWGYGCSLLNLDTATEAKIRQFVFQQEVSHRKNR